MRVEARAVLLAPPEDVWKLLAEPYRLRDWWPGWPGVEPDRRGLAPGARRPGADWRRDGQPAQTPGATGTLVIGEVVEGRVIARHDVEQGVDVRATLEPAAPHGSPARARGLGLARLPSKGCSRYRVVRPAASTTSARLRPSSDPVPFRWLKS